MANVTHTNEETTVDPSQSSTNQIRSSLREDNTMTPSGVGTTNTPSRDQSVTDTEELCSNCTRTSKLKNIFAEKLRRNKLFKIAEIIRSYWLISLFPIMFICNILSFLVMNLKHNRKSSICTYMSVIAISDNAVLVNQLFIWSVETFNLIQSKYLYCKVSAYTNHTLWAYLSYTIVFMTLDKLIAIVVPHKSALLCTVKRARINSVIIFVIVAIFFLPVLYFVGLEEYTTECTIYEMERWYVTAYMYTSMVLSPVVPFVSLTVMNSFILYTICRRKNTELGHSSIAHKVESQLTIMLVLICTTYLVLTFPFEFIELYMYYVGHGNTLNEIAITWLVVNVSLQLMTMNSGINFFLYLISGQKFRADLKILFLTCRHKT